MRSKAPVHSAAEELEALSLIISDLNDRFGIELGPEHRCTLGSMMERLADDAALQAATKVNTQENVRITFDHKVEQVIQEIVDLNFDLYKRITDDPFSGRYSRITCLISTYILRSGSKGPRVDLILIRSAFT